MDYRDYFNKRHLLTDGKSNTKTAKNKLPTFYLSLQPTNLNTKGENLCRFASKECRAACLQFAGRQSFGNVVKSRSMKTEFFVNHRVEFLQKLWLELENMDVKGKKVAVRLNLLSDVDWDAEFRKHLGQVYGLDRYKNIQFYDYTKDHLKALANTVPNYDLTVSYSGHNWKQCENILKNKVANVAVVFKNSLPLEWRGFPVINGDESDERFLERKGVIIGLRYKTPKGVPYQKNKFVVDE